MISSDLSVAQQKATAISNALATLSGVSKPTLDTQTTVQGNSAAHEAIEATLSGGVEICAAVQVATDNLQSVAKEFEALDNRVRDSLLGSAGSFK